MTELVQLELPLNCSECFLKGCECECKTCVKLRTRNAGLTQRELDRMNMEAGLAESGASEETKMRMREMLKGF